MKELEGVIALIPTPLTTEGELDEAGLKNLIDFDLANGCNGVGVLAAIGEGYLFNAAETERVVRAAVKAVNGRAPLIVGCPAMGTTAAVESCRKAEDWGADAILAFNPKYKGFDAYNIKHLVPHYTAMARAVRIPLVPYSQLDDPIPLDVLKSLVEDGLIRHIKYGPHDCATLQRTLNRLRGTGLVPRGVTRFATFEEADAWMTRQIVATHARRSSRTSPPSAGR